jgi:hypothetical protein
MHEVVQRDREGREREKRKEKLSDHGRRRLQTIFARPPACERASPLPENRVLVKTCGRRQTVNTIGS